ncbi:MAG TPA: hypothetical protein VK585_01340 [Jiangellaceae bacterium]|nr:hypothetical protein [Jiangellaceae bacterium]
MSGVAIWAPDDVGGEGGASVTGLPEPALSSAEQAVNSKAATTAVACPVRR